MCYTLWYLYVIRCGIYVLYVVAFMCYTLWYLCVIRCCVYVLYVVVFMCYTLWYLCVIRCGIYVLYGVIFMCYTVWYLCVIRCGIYVLYGVVFMCYTLWYIDIQILDDLFTIRYQWLLKRDLHFNNNNDKYIFINTQCVEKYALVKDIDNSTRSYILISIYWNRQT